MQSHNEDDFAIRNENGAVVATLWVVQIGEATLDVYCHECKGFIAIEADYAMGFGATLTGTTRRFSCAGCGIGYDLPCSVELKEQPDYE